MPRKFFRTIWKAKTPSNMEFFLEISTPFLRSIFQKTEFFCFSVHIFWLVCRTVPIFAWALRYDPEAPSRYLEHGHWMRRKFFKVISKAKTPSKIEFKKRFGSFKKLYFSRCFCFSDHSRKFSTHLMTTFKVCRRCPWIISSRSYKNQNRTTYQSKDILEKPIW